MNLNLQESSIVQQLRCLHTEYLDDFERLLLDYLDEMQRELAMCEYYESMMEGERHMMECGYLRDIDNELSIQGVY